jgi:hypothetical protein
LFLPQRGDLFYDVPMKSNFFSYNSIGFSVTQYTLKYALITKNKKGFIQIQVNSFSLECKTALQTFLKLSKKIPIAESFSSNRGLLGIEKNLIKKKAHFRSVLKNKLESTLQTEKLIIKDWVSQKSELSYFAIKDSVLDQEGLITREIGVSANHIHPSAFSFASLLEQFSDLPKLSGLFLCFDSKGCELLFFTQGQLSTGYYTSRTNPKYEQYIRSILLNFSQNPATQNIQVYLYDGGGGETAQDALYLFANKLKFKVQKANWPLRDKELPYLREIGSALVLLKKGEPFPSFARERTLISYFRKKYGFKLLFSMILFTLSLSFIHSYWKERAKQERKKSELIYQDLVQQGGILGLNSKTPSIFRGKESLIALQNELKAYRKQNPYYLLRPTHLSLSQFLYWLTSLNNALGKAKNESPISVDTLHYKWVQGSKTSKNRKESQVKIFLSFSSKTPEDARQFYQLIEMDQNFVDHKKKVTRSFQNNLYHTTFFLKNQYQRFSVAPCPVKKK